MAILIPQRKWKDWCSFAWDTRDGKVSLKALPEDLTGINQEDIYELHIRLGGGAYCGENGLISDRAPFCNEQDFKKWIRYRKEFTDIMVNYWIESRKIIPGAGGEWLHGTCVFLFVAHVLGRNIDELRVKLSEIDALKVDPIVYGVVMDDSVAFSVKRRRNG